MAHLCKRMVDEKGMKKLNLSPKELTALTVTDIERRRKNKEIGEKQADIYIKANKIKAKKYIGNSQYQNPKRLEI